MNSLIKNSLKVPKSFQFRKRCYSSSYGPLNDVYEPDQPLLIKREMDHSRFDRMKMKGKISLEDHFAIPETLYQCEKYFMADKWNKYKQNLLDVGEKRIKQMDESGLQYAILSLNSDGCQSIWDPAESVALAKKANDALAAAVKEYPDRFGAFATLPLQDPKEAIKELRRCMNELKFQGALVNGFSQIGSADTQVYLDDPRYNEFWAEMESLNVKLYLHPRNPLPSQSAHIKDHPWLMGPAWAFSIETGTHALRLIGSGLFDRHPGLKIILGHYGELVTHNIWRTNHWASKQGRNPMGGSQGAMVKAKLPFMEYYRNNFYVTTSGNFRTIALNNAAAEIGMEKILFSTDCPFEDIAEACEWFDGAEICESDRLKIGRENSMKLFNLYHLDH
ncbi:hypothetical protein ACTFIZ_010763 [Dictyostelium cf. discoideum]